MFLDIIGYIFFTMCGVILIKIGGNSQSNISVLNIPINILSVIGILSYVISFCVYMIILKKYDLSFIMPILTGLIFVSTLIASVFIFNEKITVMSCAGIALVFLGIFLINLSK